MTYPRSLSLAALLVGGACTPDECPALNASSDPADRLLAALSFPSSNASRTCAPLPSAGDAPPLVGGGDGAMVVTPGKTLALSAQWKDSRVAAINLNFGGDAFVRLPNPAPTLTGGSVGFQAVLDRSACDDLSAICHSLRCCMQAVTPSGTLSAPMAMQIVLDCTGGVGCPPPYNNPSRNCGPGVTSTSDLGPGRPDLALTGCDPACTGSTPFCNDAHHCVACLVDADCPDGRTCQALGSAAAVCVDACHTDAQCQQRRDGSDRCCSGACVNSGSDAGNCGVCGQACAFPHAAGVCAAGQCSAGVCDVGWADCNQMGTDGCETNLAIDPQSCTACGRVCSAPHAVAGCANGCYLEGCEPGFGDCDGEASNGCETSTAVDVNNCGLCGHVCKLPHATAGCNGACVVAACEPGFGDCDGVPANGCETGLLADNKNCGACGSVCNYPMACRSGACL